LAGSLPRAGWRASRSASCRSIARIPMNLAVEDALSESVLRRVLEERAVEYDIGAVHGYRGFGYLKKNVASFNNASKAFPFLLLSDLGQCACAPKLVTEWLGAEIRLHSHFVFRVAVTEVESWLLDDEENLGAFLGIRKKKPIGNPESLPDPKGTLLELATQARGIMREAVVWKDERNDRLGQGPDYNGALASFVRNSWDIRKSRKRCPSLAGLFEALERLESAYQGFVVRGPA
jgi:hypothetical protein